MYKNTCKIFFDEIVEGLQPLCPLRPPLIGLIAYQLELPQDLKCIHDIFHVFMLRKYILDPSHVSEAPLVELRKNHYRGLYMK